MNLVNRNSIKYCKKCLYNSHHPLGITFNNQGICSGCLVHEEKFKIDWKKKFSKLKILGSGEIKKNIVISAHFASKQALEKIEKVGGKISIIKK